MPTIPKDWYKSKTVWSGILKIIAGIVVSASELISGSLDPQTFAMGLISSGWGIWDIIVRFNTNQAIK